MDREVCEFCQRPLPHDTQEIIDRHETPDLIKRVGGVWAGLKLQHIFQCEVAALLRRNNPRGFPGAQPVSFAQHHFDALNKEDYYVCEKTDGLRALMYLTNDGETPVTYLLDRRNDYYFVPGLRFPHHEDPSYNRFHRETLLDGELVEDIYPDGNRIIKFLAFDLLVIDQKDLRGRSLDKRLAYLKDFLLKPYSKWLKSHPHEQPNQPFLFEDKKTEFSYSLLTMFNDIIPQVKELHGNDGLIFTCRSTKYESGTDQHILKWKPPNENTIDFLMHITWATTDPDPNDPDQSPQEDYYTLPRKCELFIYHGKNMDYSYVADLYLTPDDWEVMKSKDFPLQDAIVECFLEDVAETNGLPVTNGDARSKRWRFHRIREDKDEANHVSTFESVWESINDHVTQQVLLDHVDEIRANWKTRAAKASSR